ncbi:MAG TPA: phosphoribosyltransferase family protein [Acidimicrobiia bacterium]|nr:phosphoribosyltransferase family protein [Acidimicrobiia bacterium]
MSGTADVPPTVLLDQAAIEGHVQRLGREIARDHPDGVLLVGVLKGALIFFADLVRAIKDVDVTIDFMSISRFAPDSGRVKILHDLGSDITGRDVVLVEDIVDTGLTLAYLFTQLSARGPRRLSTCAMLDRPARRIVPQPVDYCGLALGQEYVLGYGLHVRDLYRNVPYVVAADRDTLVTRPDAYVDDLYRHSDFAARPGGSVTGVPREEEP